MKKLKLKLIKITFKDNMIRIFGGNDTVEHIEIKMGGCNEEKIVIEIYYESYNVELKHIETFIFKTDEIFSIDQRWV